MSFRLPVSRSAAGAAVEAVAAGSAAVEARPAAALPRRSGGRWVGGVAASPLGDCRPGQSPLSPGSVHRAGLPGLNLPLSEELRGQTGGERAAGTAGGGNAGGKSAK